jgi:rSAM/selenodomain-associated transferase 2
MISIIIPTLNEEEALPGCLASLTGQSGSPEVLVVDGGSDDATVEIAGRSGARVLESTRGRAVQMNHGAREATGSVLLFLHADSRLPPNATTQIAAAVEQGTPAGAFRLSYDTRAMAYRIAGHLSDLYCRATGDLFGDRGMFVRRSVFDRIGGFRPLPLMEDLDLSVRLKRHGYRVRILPSSVITSSRRFHEIGIWHGGVRAWRLCRAFHKGSSADRSAAEFYRRTVR